MTLNTQPSTINQLQPPLIKMDESVKARVAKILNL